MANPGQTYEPPKQKPSIQLNNNDYGRPMGKPLPRPETRPPIRPDGGPTSNLARKKKFMVDQQGGGRVPPQQAGPTLDAQPTPYNPVVAADGRSGMKPPQQGGPFDNRLSIYPGAGSGFVAGGPFEGGGGGLGFGMKDPRAGGLNKRTGVWTPPDPAYLEGLKNGTIEPEWKKRERWWQTNNVPGQSGEYGGTNPGGGGKWDAGVVAQPWDPSGQTNGGKPQMVGQPQGAPGQGLPPQPGGGGRQPLRPGMEYRPGGGQRPVGGGPRPFPQDGGMNQFSPEQLAQVAGQSASAQYQNQGQFNQANPEWSQQGQDQQAQWRQKLMQMQQQGPMNNQFYGAF